MQQYIYGNIEQKGYVYLTSDPGFFKDNERVAVMQHLICYDAACRHGNLPAEKHQCYWMVTSDLGIPGEEKRLFLQASGADPFRSGIYAQGYMSDSSDTDLYGPRLLKMMRTDFLSLEEVERLKRDDRLEAIACGALPIDVRLQPAELEPEVMRKILAAILRNKRVIIRLPYTGADAMRLSREYLLAIYQRLPYELRRTNGFVTGVSAAKVYDKVNELPAAVKIILMDGDADISDMESDPYLALFDLKESSDGRTQLRTNREIRPVNARLMSFLTEQEPEVLDDFFGFCKALTDVAAEGFTPDAENYALFLFFYTLSDQKSEEITDDQIRFCAANFCSKKLQERIKEILYEKIAGVLPPDRLAKYLIGAASGFDDLASLGHQDKAEKEQIESGRYSEGTVKDVHEALTLRMTDALLKYYPLGTKELLIDRLAEYFVIQGCRAYPCLMETRPTRETINVLKQLNLAGNTGGKSITSVLRSNVNASLQQKKEAVLQAYADQRSFQYEQGKAQIQNWPFLCNGMAADNIGNLYSRLQQSFYLYAELLDDGEKGSWNYCIADGIVFACTNSKPETVEQYITLLETAQSSCRHFLTNGGKFSPEQKAGISQEIEQCRHVIALSSQDCQSVDQLLQLFEEVDQTRMHPAVASKMKRTFAAAVAGCLPGGEEILSCVPRLCQYAADPLEQQLLHSVVSASPDLGVIGLNLPLDSVLSRLKSIEKLEAAKLFGGDVFFQPWDEEQTATVLRSALEGLQKYRLGMEEPQLNSRSKRQWMVEKLQSNLDLMFLLAKKDPLLGNNLIELLAREQNPITKKQIEELYIAGWSEKALCAGSGIKTSAVWKTAVHEAFPLWPELPGPAFTRLTMDGGENHILLITEPILMCMAGVLPISISAVTGFLSLPVCIWSAAVLSVGAVCCIAAGFCVPQKAQKTLLRRLAVSLLPGIIAALAALILTAVPLF